MLDRTVASFGSASILSQYMVDNISYACEPQRAVSRCNGFWWKTPEETFTDKYGFCYDLAAFALYGLLKCGLSESKLVFVRWGDWGKESNAGHFVAAFETHDGYFSIDNGVLKGPFSSFSRLLENASKGRPVVGNQFFTFEQIPFHTKYVDMAGFGV